MRIRNNKVNVFLSDDEKFILKRDCSKLNLTQSEYIRNLIVGYEIKIPEVKEEPNPQIKEDIGRILRVLCERKGVKIIEAEACPDHIHMLVSVPPKYSISNFMGYLKGKSTLMIFDRHANLKYKYGNRKFWAEGYYVDTVGKNKKIIEEYIRKQLEEDIAIDQMVMKEFIDPFTGEKVEEPNKKKKRPFQW